MALSEDQVEAMRALKTATKVIDDTLFEAAITGAMTGSRRADIYRQVRFMFERLDSLETNR